MPSEKGRPTKFDEAIGNEICTKLSSATVSLKSICKDDTMPHVSTVYRWLSEGNKEDSSFELRNFRDLYTRAREAQADLMAEEILEIADDGKNDYMTITKGDESYNVEDREVTNRSKLRIEARKWLASKLKPKKYGEKLEVDATVKTEIIPDWLKDKPDGTKV